MDRTGEVWEFVGRSTLTVLIVGKGRVSGVDGHKHSTWQWAHPCVNMDTGNLSEVREWSDVPFDTQDYASKLT